MRAVLSNLAKNRLLTACGALVLTEAGLLVAWGGSAFAEGMLPAAITVVFLAWFWTGAFAIARTLLRGIAGLAETHPRRALLARLALATALTAAALHHVLGWALYLRTGQFANLASIEFAIRNPPATTWLYLTSAEQIALIAAGVMALLSIPAIAVATRRCESWCRGESRKPLLLPWALLTMLLVGLVHRLECDLSPTRLGVRENVLLNCVNPQLTFFSSVYERLTLEPIEPVLDHAELTPIGEWSAPARSRRAPGVIFVAIEALRHDVVHLRHQGREVTPHLNRLARGGLEWRNAYSQSTHSDYSDVCIVSSLYPLRTREHHYYQRRDPWPRTLAFDVFKQAGYRTAIISSQNEAWGCMDQFLETPSLDLFYDAQRSGAETYISERDRQFQYENEVGTFSAGCLYDPHTTDRAIAWIEESIEQDKPFFVSMNFQASHFPYELPAGADRPFQPCELSSDISFLEYPREKTHLVRNAYFNGVHHCDQQLGRLVAALEKADRLDDVILVVMGENGEAFHESGTCGHAREPVEPAIHVAAVMHAPRYLTPRVEHYPTELIDLLPTVFGLVGWQPHANFQGIDVLSDSRPALADRLLFFHANSPAAHADAVQWAGRWKFIRDHRTGRGFLRDIINDPGETQNFADEHPEIASRLSNVLNRWRKRQLAYYHFPAYYENYFPPRPPRLLPLAEGAPRKGATINASGLPATLAPQTPVWRNGGQN